MKPIQSKQKTAGVKSGYTMVRLFGFVKNMSQQNSRRKVNVETLAANRTQVNGNISVLTLVQRKKETDSNQLDLFPRDMVKNWISQTVDVARSIPKDRFYFSEIKERCGLGPVHQNHWGFVGVAMRRAGFIQLQEWRRTKTGNRDYLWMKP